MVKLIIVDKGGNLKCSDVKNFDKETLFKKCNLRKNDNFDKRATWKMNNEYYVSLFAKDKGRATSENKYDLPPPIDKELYFGSMILVKHCYNDLTNETAEDFSLEEWNKLYEKLFGGFEDLGEDDSYSEEEEIPSEFQTKQDKLSSDLKEIDGVVSVFFGPNFITVSKDANAVWGAISEDIISKFDKL